MNRRGLTFVELMIVVTILGIVVNMALPRLHDVRRRAEAASVIRDFIVVRGAAFDHFANAGEYPPTGGWGQVPPELVPTLPLGFSFSEPNVTYRWRRWALGPKGPQLSGESVLLGLQIKTSDVKLMASINGLYRGPLAFGSATQVTLVID